MGDVALTDDRVRVAVSDEGPGFVATALTAGAARDQPQASATMTQTAAAGERLNRFCLGTGGGSADFAAEDQEGQHNGSGRSSLVSVPSDGWIQTLIDRPLSSTHPKGRRTAPGATS